jgi:hypothetical protein
LRSQAFNTGNVGSTRLIVYGWNKVDVEPCKNCGRTIGILEQAFVHQGHIVCKECKSNLGNELDAQKTNAPTDTPKRKLSKSGILWAALIVWTIFIFWIWARTAFSGMTEAEKHHSLDPARQGAEAALGCWTIGAFVLWFLGALPLFISAIVKGKRG